MAKKKVTTKKSPKKGVKKKVPKGGNANRYKAEEKKNKPDLNKAASKISTKDTSLSQKGVKTLLKIPNRAKLPPTPEVINSKLYDIVKNYSDEYKEFLAFIRAGVSVSSACAGSGLPLNQAEVIQYLKWGAQDISRSAEIEDTYFSRFFIDFSRTAGETVGEAEQKVLATDPKFWLRNSPLARMFGDHWRDDPDKKVSHVHSGSIDHFLGASEEEKVNPDELVLDAELVEGALEEMAGAGLVKLTDDYHTAKKIQRGEILSDEEMESLEDRSSLGSEGVLQLDNQGMPLLLPKPEE